VESTLPVIYPFRKRFLIVIALKQKLPATIIKINPRLFVSRLYILGAFIVTKLSPIIKLNCGSGYNFPNTTPQAYAEKDAKSINRMFF
jgi:hypothetical protein